MAEAQKRRAGPPLNPGVRDLVSNLRRHHPPPDRQSARLGFRGWHERGYVPHYDVSGVTQFVTFRLADSLPAEVGARLAGLEDESVRRRVLEAALDQGHGSCWLRRAEIAALVDGALRFFHDQRYDLRAWCVMPNHVHVLFHVTDTPMTEIVESWKSFTALEANRRLKRAGGVFWQAGYCDTFMRDAGQETRTVRYIEQNPGKAKLVLEPKEWPWSSPGRRDEYERLVLPPGGGKPSPRRAGSLPAAAALAPSAKGNSDASLADHTLRPGWPRAAGNASGTRTSSP